MTAKPARSALQAERPPRPCGHPSDGGEFRIRNSLPSEVRQSEKFPSFGGAPEGRGGRSSRNYYKLPYNPKLKDRAKKLRKTGNLAEVLMWNQIKNKQFKGFDFDRQKIIGSYIVDFYCTNCNAVIEIDGSSHNGKEKYDAIRDAFLQGLGLTVIHIRDVEVKRNMGGVMAALYDHPALAGTPPVEGNLGQAD